MKSLSLMLLTATLLAADAPNQKPAEPEAFMTVEAAGKEYRLQGEFQADKWGVDIINLGKAKFRAVIFKGGLPGSGWDASKRIEVDGQGEGEVVNFQGTWNGQLKESTLTLKNPEGESISLQRVIRHSPTEGAAAPQGAVILFDGKNVDAWKNTKMDDRQWLRCGGRTVQTFKDYTLHLEFYLPLKPLARGQSRANSGVYNQDRYEVQVLDSFGLKGLDNECGGIYQQYAPLVNMCYPPLQWQTYDIDFTAARFGADGKKTANAIITVRHNGVVVQDHSSLKHQTPGSGLNNETDTPGPLYLQDHGNPVYYRNIWLVEKN
jgi:hypothetical protein